MFVSLSQTIRDIQYLFILEILEALKTVIKYNGISGLWMGLTSTLLRDVPFSAIYWLNYETIKQKFHKTQQTFTFNFIAGAVAGSVSISINKLNKRKQHKNTLSIVFCR